MSGMRIHALAALLTATCLAAPALALDQPVVWRDDTGCAYLLTPQGGISPRLKRDGLPDCPDATPGPPLTSAPIIFHLATGSGTLNGTGYFSILQSSNEFLGSGPDISTRAFYTTDGVNNNLGTVYDVPVASHTFILKSGGGQIQYLWDWIVTPTYKTPYDGN